MTRLQSLLALEAKKFIRRRLAWRIAEVDAGPASLSVSGAGQSSAIPVSGTRPAAGRAFAQTSRSARSRSTITVTLPSLPAPDDAELRLIDLNVLCRTIRRLLAPIRGQTFCSFWDVPEPSLREFSLWRRKGIRSAHLSRTCGVRPKDYLRSAIFMIALSAFGISSGLASDKNSAKHSSKITKATAERIALTKVPDGRIRSAELETARGQHFWSVYVVKPGSKNAKEIRVDAASAKILAVQTERPEDQAEEPPKAH
jgi:hypothetical protein